MIHHQVRLLFLLFVYELITYSLRAHLTTYLILFFPFFICFVCTEMWTVSGDNSGEVSFVRNHFWDGYSFYTVLNSSEYGGAYFGLGVPNYDIAFMM